MNSAIRTFDFAASTHPTGCWYRITYMLSDGETAFKEVISVRDVCPISAAVNGAMAICNTQPEIITLRFVGIEQMTPEAAKKAEQTFDDWRSTQGEEE
ncbi:TPA: hypothetical protein ACHJX8_000479 [Yersinia enterocolitica]|uniref:hypothetical protein n=1 Tax=Yersinia massiliensis TaxID=419257 RepID=UPI0028D3E1FA|nr:hypothetical protein [Yersinia massiliensis]